MSIPVFEAETVREGLTFGEDPRWRNGILYYSDFYTHTVNTFDPATKENKVILQLPKGEVPSGLGWLKDGTMLVVHMQQRKLIAVAKDGSVSDYADLNGVCEFWPNDMVVSSSGVACEICVVFLLLGLELI
jgi:sugar lactone lactonase YvrE